jgi:hypothetical protein
MDNPSHNLQGQPQAASIQLSTRPVLVAKFAPEKDTCRPWRRIRTRIGGLVAKLFSW